MNLTEITHLSAAEREELIRWYQRMSESERVDVHRDQTSLLRHNRQRLRDVEQPLATYGALLLALANRRQLLAAPAKKSALSDEAAAEIGRLRRQAITQKKRREGEVARLIRVRWLGEIQKLRGAGHSWREISDYVAKWHRRRVSHTYLKKIFEHLEAERRAREVLSD